MPRRSEYGDAHKQQRMSIILWIVQGLVGVVFFFVWNTIQEMRADINTLKARETSVAELKLKTATTEDVVKEVRSELKLLNSAVQDVRVALLQRIK